MRMDGHRHAPAALPRERSGTLCRGGCVGPRAGLDRYGKFALTGIRSPDRSARSELLYLLSYPDLPLVMCVTLNSNVTVSER